MQAQYISRTLLVVGFSLNHRDSCMLFAAAQSFPLYSRLTGSGGGVEGKIINYNIPLTFISLTNLSILKMFGIIRIEIFQSVIILTTPLFCDFGLT